MLGVGADVGEEAPAAFAFGVGADFDGGGEGVAAGEVEVAEDEEFLQRGHIGEDGVTEADLGEGELDGGFEVGADLLGLTGGLDGLLDDGAGFEEVFDGGEGGVGLTRPAKAGTTNREGLQMDAVVVAEEFPGLVGGVGEDGGEQLHQGLGDFADGGLGGAAAGAVRGVAVEAVLGDVDVERGEIAGDELGDGADDLAEVVGGVAGEALGGDDVEALEDPAVDEGVSGSLGRAKARTTYFVLEVSEEDAEGVADAAVALAGLLEEFFAEGDVVLVIDAGGPEADHVAAVFVVVVVGGHGLGGFVAALVAFADLFAAGIDDEAIGDDGLIRRGAAHGDADHETALEPAAMLIGALDIHIGGAVQLGMTVQNGDGGGAGVDPHIERVFAALAALGEAHEVAPEGVVFFKPEVRAVLLDGIGDLVRDGGVHDGLAVGIVEDGQRHAPGALAADAPVWAAFDGAVDAIPAPGGQPVHGVDGLQGIGAEVADADEELLDGAEDDGRLRTPAVRILVNVGRVAEQGAFGLQDLDDAFVALEDVPADEVGQSSLGGVAAGVIDGREDVEAVLFARDVVVRAVAGSHVDGTSAGVIGDEEGIDDLRGAREEGMLRLAAVQVFAFELRGGLGGIELEASLVLEGLNA